MEKTDGVTVDIDITRITSIDQLKKILKPIIKKKFDMKKYKEENKEKFKNYNNNYQKQIIICTCGARINYGSRRYHVKSNKHLKRINEIALMKENRKRVIDEKEDETDIKDVDDRLKSLLIKVLKNLEDLKSCKQVVEEAVEEQFKRLRDKVDNEEYEGFEEKE